VYRPKGHVSPTQAKKFTPSSNVTVAVLLP
jgi:hypothetical protein